MPPVHGTSQPHSVPTPQSIDQSAKHTLNIILFPTTVRSLLKTLTLQSQDYGYNKHACEYGTLGTDPMGNICSWQPHQILGVICMRAQSSLMRQWQKHKIRWSRRHLPSAHLVIHDWCPHTLFGKASLIPRDFVNFINKWWSYTFVNDGVDE